MERIDNSSTTSISLLNGARSNDPEAWRQMSNVYSPLVFSWLKRAGLNDNDAADLVQDVFKIVIQHLNRFRRESEHDSFRGWLFVLTRNELRRWYRGVSKNRELAIGGTESVRQMAAIPDWVDDESQLEEDIATDEQAESLMIRRAAEAIKDDFAEHTWQAFWRATVENEPAAEIAADLEMTEGGVRQAKFRVLKRLKEFLC